MFQRYARALRPSPLSIQSPLTSTMAFTVFAENLTKSLEPMLASYSQSLLQKISEDYKLPYEELSTRYLTSPVAPPPKVKAPAKKKSTKETLPQCSGLTAKGGQCQHKAFDESGLCRIHQKKAEGQSRATGTNTVPPAKEPKEKKKESKKKVKEPAPVHTHEPTVSDPLCGLCESHGNPLNPELPSTQFESDGLADRLKALIMAEGESEEAEEEIPVAEPVEEDPEATQEMESDYEDEGEALTQALRNMVAQE
jgi:hypothetical protein